MRTCVTLLGLAIAGLLAGPARAQDFAVAPVLNVPRHGTTVESAANYSRAQCELAIGLREYYRALARRAEAEADRAAVETNLAALRSLAPETARPRTAANDRALAWPAPLDGRAFAADRQRADPIVLSWTLSPDGIRAVDKQRLRAALAGMHGKLKRARSTMPPDDFQAADEFLAGLAHTVISPRASLD